MKTCSGTTCKAKEWNAFIDSVRTLPREEQVRAVNREMNDKPYVTDPVNWHMADYWATPLQFLRKDGDCEDYAISKYMALKALGFCVDEMRIVVLQDTNLNVPMRCWWCSSKGARSCSTIRSTASCPPTASITTTRITPSTKTAGGCTAARTA